MSLDGYYRGTNTKVNPNDEEDRKRAIEALRMVFDWILKSNPEEYKIDLLHIGRRGGVDVEKGGWVGRYKDQFPENFNKYTLPFPTANFPWRKEHFFNAYYEWVTTKGYKKSAYETDFEFNSLIRFNRTYTEFFFIDYETYKKMVKNHGSWSTDTVWSTDGNGNKVPELWMCWELKDVPFYVLENGVWVRDTTFDDIDVYNKYVENYLKSYNMNKK